MCIDAQLNEKIKYLLEWLAPNEMITKSYQLTPIQTGYFIPQRANLSYESSDDSGGGNLPILNGHSSAFIAMPQQYTNTEESSLSSPRRPTFLCFGSVVARLPPHGLHAMVRETGEFQLQPDNYFLILWRAFFVFVVTGSNLVFPYLTHYLN